MSLITGNLVLRGRVGSGVLAAALVVTGLASVTARAAPYVDPLDVPAAMDNRAEREPLIAVADAGSRLVAVGQRGLIVYSDDQGVSWKQAPVPVQSDLVAVHFIDAKNGWATGHAGVVLHSGDGGLTWTRQFDGRGNLAFKDVYQKRVDAGDASAKPYVQILKLNTAGQPSLPWLGVVFENANDGYAVGPYGMIMASHDGGAHWEPWLDHIDNPDFLNLNAVSVIGGNVYVAGEKGRVYKLDRARQFFVAAQTKYAGSFFGVTGKDNVLVAYGLLGHIYRSADAGASWQPAKNDQNGSILDGVALPDGRIALASQAGQLLVGNQQNDTFKSVELQSATPFAGIALDGGKGLAMVGLGGIAINQLP